jgi:UDP-3-O-[3-hydroxymyristoyl] glucosamine N-acyltransferase
MSISLESIIEVIKSKNVDFYVNGPAIAVEAMAALGTPVRNSLCYYVGEDAGQLADIRDSIIICKPDLNVQSSMNNTFIFAEHPQFVFYCVSTLFEEGPDAGIHESAMISKKAQIGAGISVGPFCIIDECRIGDRVIIESGVRIHKGTVIGNDVQVQSNTVIGATGIMWTWDSHGNKVACAQTGGVIIEDNVIIGSNITIVRGTYPNKPTFVGEGTMISHGTMIGHGVVIGLRNHFANNVSLAGTVSTGNNCFFGSSAVVRPHISIAADTIIGAGAVVVKNVLEEGQVLAGNPARPMSKNEKKPSGVPGPY